MKRMFGWMALVGVVLWMSAPVPAEDAKSDKAKSDKEAKALPAAEFAQKVAGSDMYEIKSSEIAKTQSQSDKVKQFAEHMIADHSKANAELMALASKKNLAIAPGVSPKQADMLKKLGTLQGKEFDTEYLQQQEKAHDMTVAMFRAQAKGGDDADVKAWAEKTLPTLEKHHKHVKELRDGTDNKGSKTGTDK